MTDFTPEDADDVIDAAAAGEISGTHADLSAALGELHAPLPPAAGTAGRQVQCHVRAPRCDAPPWRASADGTQRGQGLLLLRRPERR